MRSAIESASPFIRPLLSHLATERGLAVNTLLAYRADLEDAEKFLAARARSWLSAAGDDYCAYLQSQSLAGMATKTVARRFAALRVMLRFILGEYEGNQPIKTLIAAALSRIERPKPARPLPKFLSAADSTQLLDAGCNPKSRLYLRDVAIFQLLDACGLRASEICVLRIRDLNLSERFLRAFGKGSKERMIPMHPRAAEAVRRYLAECRPKLAAASPRPARMDPLFLSDKGRPLDRIRLGQIVEAAGRRAGLARSISPHTLRHGFATGLMRGGADLRVVQELLGHADLSTTEIYTHLDMSKMKAMHQKYHPRG